MQRAWQVPLWLFVAPGAASGALGLGVLHSSIPMPSKLLHVCRPQGKAGVTADGVRERETSLVSVFMAAPTDGLGA
jgi:hypothetical protein